MPIHKENRKDYYETIKCPVCRQKKIKIIKVTRFYHRIGVHSKPQQPFIECAGSGKRIDSNLKV